MKKLLLILFSGILLTGCSDKFIGSGISEVSAENLTELQTEIPTEPETELPVTEISDNIRLYNLELPENKEYCQKNLVVGLSYEMLGYGTITEKNKGIILETSSGEQKELISTDDYDGFVYADIKCRIDDSRFVYRITAEESIIECGVYNLETGEKFSIENNTGYTNYSYYPQYMAGNYLILYKGRTYSDKNFCYSRLNLDTFELTDIDSEYISKEQCTPSVAFSQDGKTASVVSEKNGNGEYIVTLFSVDDDIKTAEYKFCSDNEYKNFDLKFVSENQLYIYAHKKDDIGNNYLYVIDIPQKYELTDWQKTYKQTLYDFMESDKYFSGDDIIKHSAFSIYDLNTDGIPELIISEDTSHTAGCLIYTYDNGLIYLGRMGTYGDIGYYEDNDMIVSYDVGQGFEHEIFFRLENNEMNMIAKFYNDLGYYGEENATYKLNDADMTKDEYNIELEKYKGNNYISLGRDYSFDETDKAFSE